MSSGNASPLGRGSNWCDHVQATLRCFMGLIRPVMCYPDAHKDPSASITEKEEKCWLSIPYLHFKCVQMLAILDLIK